jgi:hypothetical protein
MYLLHLLHLKVSLRSAIASFADIIAPFASKDACEVPAKDVMMPSNAKPTSGEAKRRRKDAMTRIKQPFKKMGRLLPSALRNGIL